MGLTQRQKQQGIETHFGSGRQSQRNLSVMPISVRTHTDVLQLHVNRHQRWLYILSYWFNCGKTIMCTNITQPVTQLLLMTSITVGRASAFLFSICESKFFSNSGISGGKTVLLFFILLNTSASWRPVKGFLPTNSRYSTTPRDQMSAFLGSRH